MENRKFDKKRSRNNRRLALFCQMCRGKAYNNCKGDEQVQYYGSGIYGKPRKIPAEMRSACGMRC